MKYNVYPEICLRSTRVECFLTPAPKAGVIVLACAVRAATAAGINIVGVPQTKPMQRFPSNFQDMFTTKGSRAD